MRKRRTKTKAATHEPVKGTAYRPQSEGEAFDPRDYFLSTPAEPQQEQAKDDFDIREWLLLDAVEPETEAMRIQRLLGDAGFPELHVEAADDDGSFHFGYRILNPETYTTEIVFNQLVAALERMGYTGVIIQIATRLNAGMTSGTFWVARR